MKLGYIRCMDGLYVAAVAICVVSIVCMTGMIFTGVLMRYVFHVGARFAEPLSIFFAVQLTMYGAAACYRARAHLSLELFVNYLPRRLRQLPQYLVHALMAGVALFMLIYGLSLVETTWFQSYPEFEAVRVGFVYSAIPGSGIVTLLFVVEAVLFRDVMSERLAAEARRAEAQTEAEARRIRL
jgi:TRAP-type C4-dicarboxylate transport system permease small subunit